MNAIVFEHVPVAELPLAWREKLTSAQVTVRIEEEAPVSAQDTEAPGAAQVAAAFANDPLFGMWRDREDMADVAAYVRRIREPRFTEPRFTEPRFNGDGSRNEFPQPTAPGPDDKNAD